MKKFFVMFLAITLLFGLTACNSAPKTEIKYFPLEVTHEMAPDYVLKYVYHYNEDWVQTGISSYINDELDQELTYELDPEKNQVLKTITTLPDGSVSEIVHRNTYDEKGNVIHQELVADGVVNSVNEFTYDKDGNRTSQTTTSENSLMGLSISKYTFDKDGNLLTWETTYTGTEEYPGSGSCITYTYDEYGNQIESVQTGYTNDPGAVAGAGRTVSEVKDGKITKTTAYDLDGNVTEIREFTWEGNVETEFVCNSDGDLQLTVTRTYDDAGNLLVSETESALGGSVSSSTYTYQKAEVPVK